MFLHLERLKCTELAVFMAEDLKIYPPRADLCQACALALSILSASMAA